MLAGLDILMPFLVSIIADAIEKASNLQTLYQKMPLYHKRIIFI